MSNNAIGIIQKFIMGILLYFLLLPVFARVSCDSCGYAYNAPDTKYCRGCGSSMAQGVKCSACDFMNAPHDAYCLECSAKLADQEKTPEKKVIQKMAPPPAAPFPAENTRHVFLEGLPEEQKRQSIWIQDKEMSLRDREKSGWTGGVSATDVKALQNKGFFLFCYQKLENTAARFGLYEVAKGLPLSRAKPVVAPFGASVEVIRTETVDFTEPAKASLTCVYLKVKSPNGFFNYNGRPVQFEELQGYAIKKNVR